jgi:hypothetical protein
MLFEPRHGPLFELRGGLWPSRGEARVDPAGASVWPFEVSAGGASRVLSEKRVLR